jgi:hypothetical protein
MNGIMKSDLRDLYPIRMLGARAGDSCSHALTLVHADLRLRSEQRELSARRAHIVYPVVVE